MKKWRNHFGFFFTARYTLGVDKNRWEKSQGAKCSAGPQNNCQNVQLQLFFGGLLIWDLLLPITKHELLNDRRLK